MVTWGLLCALQAPCRKMTVQAPYFSEIAQGPDETAHSHWLRSSDGVRLRAVHWTPADTKGTVLIFPGRTEYIEKYAKDARLLLASGYAVAVIDWRGQGLSDRLATPDYVGHVDHFADYQKDVHAFLAHLDAQALPKPYFLLAHSMGGAIGLRALLNALPVKAAAFSAPMWGIAMSPWARIFGRIAARIATLIGQGKTLVAGQEKTTYVLRGDPKDNTLTNDPQMWAYMRDQAHAHPELTLGGPSYTWLLEALAETDALSQTAPPNVPTVTFLGDQETIVDPAPIHRKMLNWPQGDLVLLKGSKHETLMETPDIRDAVFRRITAQFDAHL